MTDAWPLLDIPRVPSAKHWPMSLMGPSLRGPASTNSQRRPRTGRYSSPLSRAVTCSAKRLSPCPWRPTWLCVTGREQCTEVTLLSARFNLHTRVLINGQDLTLLVLLCLRWAFKNARFDHCSITLRKLFRLLQLLLRTLSLLFYKKYNFRLSSIAWTVFLILTCWMLYVYLALTRVLWLWSFKVVPYANYLLTTLLTTTHTLGSTPTHLRPTSLSLLGSEGVRTSL